MWLAATALAGDGTRISGLGRGRLMRELTAFDGVFGLPAVPHSEPAGAAEVRGVESVTVDVVAPDRSCASAFVELSESMFPYELVGTGSSWVIRVWPPLGEAWEGRLLLLVQRWLEACPLPCATICFRRRRYLVRSASTHTRVAGNLGARTGASLDFGEHDRSLGPRLVQAVESSGN